MVGAVLVRDRAVVGEGWHAEYGGAHAERMMLDAAGALAKGATAYVTLEPCNHHGQTPPCARALIDAGVARVVFAAADPNPESGDGAGALGAAHIEVGGGLRADEARELNAPFHHRFESDRPFVTLKLALSLDSALADASRRPGALTGARARRYVHHLRAGHDAIAVGSGTVLADDPRLTVRGVPRPRVAPARVVFDRRGRVPASARLVRSASQVRTFFVGDDPPASALMRVAASGVELLGARSLEAALRMLRARGINALLCEGGAEIAGALLTHGLVDRLVIFRAPVLLGAGAIPAFGSAPSLAVSAAPRWRIVEQRMFGDDEMIVYAKAT
jgi:diaminohydroxyphosphoribosylaminopyrimidine deaminase/5-amino-6-(5-phosphoribosylamino)uracil reductase